MEKENHGTLGGGVPWFFFYFALRGLSSENGFKFRASHPVWGWAGL